MIDDRALLLEFLRETLVAEVTEICEFYIAYVNGRAIVSYYNGAFLCLSISLKQANEIVPNTRYIKVDLHDPEASSKIRTLLQEINLIDS